MVAICETREYIIPASALAALEEGAAISLGKMPAGTTVLWGPRVLPSGDVSIAFSVPSTDAPAVLEKPER